MRYIITALLVLLSIASYGQGTVPFGATRIQDTAYTKGGLKADGDVRFTKYGTLDTNKVFGIAPNGLLVLRQGGSAPADTNLWVKVNGQTLPKSDTIGMKGKALYFNDPNQLASYIFNVSPSNGNLNIDDIDGNNLTTLSTSGDFGIAGGCVANTISANDAFFAPGMTSTVAPISGYVTKIVSNGELATQATIPISNITGAVPATRTITINGNSQDLSADRTYNVGTVNTAGYGTIITGGGTTLNVDTSKITKFGGNNVSNYTLGTLNTSPINLMNNGNKWFRIDSLGRLIRGNPNGTLVNDNPTNFMPFMANRQTDNFLDFNEYAFVDVSEYKKSIPGSRHAFSSISATASLLADSGFNYAHYRAFQTRSTVAMNNKDTLDELTAYDQDDAISGGNVISRYGLRLTIPTMGVGTTLQNDYGLFWKRAIVPGAKTWPIFIAGGNNLLGDNDTAVNSFTAPRFYAHEVDVSMNPLTGLGGYMNISIQNNGECGMYFSPSKVNIGDSTWRVGAMGSGSRYSYYVKTKFVSFPSITADGLNGFVGIGSLTPTRMLDVFGSALIRDSVEILHTLRIDSTRIGDAGTDSILVIRNHEVRKVAPSTGTTNVAGYGIALTAGGTTINVDTTVALITSTSGIVRFGTQSKISSPSNGNLLWTNAAGTDAGLLQAGGTTSSFPAWQRSGSGWTARLADNSANTSIAATLYFGTSLQNVASANAATINVAATGVGLVRNINDGTTAVTSLKNQGTGLIHDFRYGTTTGTSVASIDINGYLTHNSPAYSSGGYTLSVHNTTSNRIENVTTTSLIGIRGSASFSGNAVLTTFTVTHGLGTTPTQVLVTPTSSAAISPYVTNKTSTTFDVNYLAAPALGTNNVTFDWQATQ